MLKVPEVESDGLCKEAWPFQPPSIVSAEHLVGACKLIRLLTAAHCCNYMLRSSGSDSSDAHVTVRSVKKPFLMPA